VNSLEINKRRSE